MSMLNGLFSFPSSGQIQCHRFALSLFKFWTEESSRHGHLFGANSSSDQRSGDCRGRRFSRNSRRSDLGSVFRRRCRGERCGPGSSTTLDQHRRSSIVNDGNDSIFSQSSKNWAENLSSSLRSVRSNIALTTKWTSSTWVTEKIVTFPIRGKTKRKKRRREVHWGS